MVSLRQTARTPRFVPDYMALSLADIDFEKLQKDGIRFIAFDADSTLVTFWGMTMLTPTRQLLLSKRSLFKGWCIASNRFARDLQPLADSIDAVVVRATILTRKPSKRYFKRVLAKLEAKPEETAMIGDKLIADMWGGKRAGMTTVWVEKIGHDNPLDRLLQTRRFEKKLMQAYIPDK